jgi:glucose-6-phosphate-specific signal transduction histidine kinase
VAGIGLVVGDAPKWQLAHDPFTPDGEGAGSAHVRVAIAAAGVDLAVTNPVTAAVATRARDGHGLIGIRERATLLGGDDDVARANGTFRVHARLPYRGRRA